MELLITAGITAVVGTLLGVLTVSGLRSWNQNRAQVEAQETARDALARMTKLIREAQTSSNGSYPISAAAAQSLTFYTNVDSDTDREQVRFFLQGTELREGVIQPTGTPATYPAGNETIRVMATNVRNGAQAVFTYYDENFTGTEAALTQPVTTQNVRLVHVNVQIDTDINLPPTSLTLETNIAFRNLKDNL